MANFQPKADPPLAETLTDKNFKTEVLESKIPVLVDFWAEWCHPCRIVGPIVEELAAEYAGRLKVGKVNVDENQVAGNYGIMSIPSLLIFKDGKVVKTMVGAQSKENFKREIDSVL
jgi:thioredoxin 1